MPFDVHGVYAGAILQQKKLTLLNDVNINQFFSEIHYLYA